MRYIHYNLMVTGTVKSIQQSIYGDVKVIKIRMHRHVQNRIGNHFCSLKKKEKDISLNWVLEEREN